MLMQSSIRVCEKWNKQIHTLASEEDSEMADRTQK